MNVVLEITEDSNARIVEKAAKDFYSPRDIVRHPVIAGLEETYNESSFTVFLSDLQPQITFNINDSLHEYKSCGVINIHGYIDGENDGMIKRIVSYLHHTFCSNLDYRGYPVNAINSYGEEGEKYPIDIFYSTDPDIEFFDITIDIDKLSINGIPEFTIDKNI